MVVGYQDQSVKYEEMIYLFTFINQYDSSNETVEDHTETIWELSCDNETVGDNTETIWNCPAVMIRQIVRIRNTAHSTGT